MTNEDPQLPQFSLTIRQRVWRLRIICLSTKLPGVREHLVRVYRVALVVWLALTTQSRSFSFKIGFVHLQVDLLRRSQLGFAHRNHSHLQHGTKAIA
jgi:hypothetical protein